MPRPDERPGPDFNFLAGRWRTEVPGGVYEEVWLTPTANAVSGHAREVRDGRTAFMEFFSLEDGPDGWSLNILLGAASRGPKVPAVFRLVEHRAGRLIFRRDSEGFPKQIEYHSGGRFHLTCILIGEEEKRTETLDFRREP
ncbi:MAG: DUF6265 family protein [Fimbriimonadaceae bacterium]|nr:DUF6265 family protein [Fimbriimonadaceae bacterium]